MFVGHLAVAFAGKAVSRSTSLVWFVAAANLVDLIWPLLLLAGVERARIDPGNTAFTAIAFDSYPWTHSLLMGVAWGIALAALARRFGVGAAGARLVAAIVVSHWVLDFVTHRPDLPLWPWPDGAYGLGLWHSIPATFAVEGLMWVAAIVVLLRVRRPGGLQGQLALWSFVLVCTVLWATIPFSAPPPSDRALAWFSLIGWSVVPWAWWIERSSRPVRVGVDSM
jgi:membrane-bound metal-dependent hydrolase YbcI (DUF457 family)